MNRRLLNFIFLISLNSFGQSGLDSIDDKGNRKIYNINGRLVEYHILTGGNNLTSKEPLLKIIFKYDSIDRLSEKSYHKPTGELFGYGNGIASIRYKYSTPQIIEEFYFDKNNKPTIDILRNVFSIRRKFDQHGLLNEEAYYDTHGNLSSDKNGIARIIYKYTKDGIIEQESYFNDINKLVRIDNDETKYLSSIRWNSSTMPKWLKQTADQRNTVNGLEDQGVLKYELRMYEQSYSGQLKFHVQLSKPHLSIKTMQEVENNGVPRRTVSKIVKALKKASFLSLGSQKDDKDIEAFISFLFIKEEPPTN